MYWCVCTHQDTAHPTVIQACCITLELCMTDGEVWCRDVDMAVNVGMAAGEGGGIIVNNTR